MPSIKTSLSAQSWHEICNNCETLARGKILNAGEERGERREKGRGWECWIVIKLKCSLNCQSLLGDKDWSISASSRAEFAWLEGPGRGLALTRGCQSRPPSGPADQSWKPRPLRHLHGDLAQTLQSGDWRVVECWSGVGWQHWRAAVPAFTENTPSSVAPLWWPESPGVSSHHLTSVMTARSAARQVWTDQTADCRHSEGKICRQRDTIIPGAGPASYI